MSKHYPKINAGKSGADHPSKNPIQDLGAMPAPIDNSSQPMAPGQAPSNGNPIAQLLMSMQH